MIGAFTSGFNLVAKSYAAGAGTLQAAHLVKTETFASRGAMVMAGTVASVAAVAVNVLFAASNPVAYTGAKVGVAVAVAVLNGAVRHLGERRNVDVMCSVATSAVFGAALVLDGGSAILSLLTTTATVIGVGYSGLGSYLWNAWGANPAANANQNAVAVNQNAAKL